MRTVFMGTGDIGLPSLKWLLESEACEMVGVYTQPDKPVGRKQVLTPPEVKVLARQHGVPVFQPERLRKPDPMDELRALHPDLIVIMAYGQILKKEVIDLPTVACINLHASILPRHRGAAPIQGAIADGDAESGVTVMYVDVGLDTGDILLTETCPIRPADTGGILHDRLAGLAPRALARAVDALAAGDAPRISQDKSRATYHPKLTREHGRIDWTRNGVEIERLVRAYDPWPGTTTLLDGQTLRILPRVTPGMAAGSQPGMITAVDADAFTVACGGGTSVAIHEVQLEGRKRMPVRAFLAGNLDRLRVGKVLG